jgi:hypothetical protein
MIDGAFGDPAGQALFDAQIFGLGSVHNWLDFGYEEKY